MAGYVGTKAVLLSTTAATVGGDADIGGALDVGGAITGVNATLSGGVYLGGTGSANKLDDYEEGTWTGVFTDLTNNATMLTNYETGLYTKVGRVVTVTGYFYASSLGSVSGSMYLSGLPFSNGSTNRYGSSVSIGAGASLTITAGYAVVGIIAPSASVITLNLWDATFGTSNLQSGEFSSSGGFYITASYITDA